jgi:ribosomal protein L20A (L18A)
LFQKHNKATNASNPRVEMSMGTRHGSKRADIGMERLKEEEEDEVFDDRI